MVKLDPKEKEQFGNKLRAAREKQNLTQVEVAKRAQIHFNSYAKIERGVSFPRTDVLNKIIKALGIESSEILPY